MNEMNARGEARRRGWCGKKRRGRRENGEEITRAMTDEWFDFLPRSVRERTQVVHRHRRVEHSQLPGGDSGKDGGAR